MNKIVTQFALVSALLVAMMASMGTAHAQTLRITGSLTPPYLENVPSTAAVYAANVDGVRVNNADWSVSGENAHLFSISRRDNVYRPLCAAPAIFTVTVRG